MKVHCFTTGTVTLTQSWQKGTGGYLSRLVSALFDSRFTEPLPIWCFLIEHPEGLILIDTGIPLNANAPVWFPLFMPLVQRAAPFQIASTDEEIGPQLRAAGFATEDVRWVILTHLHQDHEGGLHYFPNATFIASKSEWDVSQGFAGRMGGYLNFRWFDGFAPQTITFDEPDAIFGGRHTVTEAGDVYLVPTPGHSPGHLSVVVEEDDSLLFFAGDASYTQQLLLENALDGVSQDEAAVRRTHQNIMGLGRQRPIVYTPSHEWAAKERLENREVMVVPSS